MTPCADQGDKARSRSLAENVIQKKSFRFALAIINLYCRLQDKHKFVLSKQVLRSGTSIGANVEEAIAGQSRKDFVSKMAITTKEARETKYWLHLLQESDLLDIDLRKELAGADELLRILSSIVMTTKQNATIHNS